MHEDSRSWEEPMHEAGVMYDVKNSLMELNALIEDSELFKTGLTKAEEHDRCTERYSSLLEDFQKAEHFLPAQSRGEIMGKLNLIYKNLFPTKDFN